MPDYRITLRGKHLYSASLYANCVNATAAKLKYVVQHFMLFPMIYSKLGHKLVNVKTARINKLLIAFVHRITLRKHLYSATVYAKSVYSIVPQLDYVVKFFLLFRAMYSKCGTSTHTSKPQGLISANYSVCISVIKFQTGEFALRKHQYSASVRAKSDFPIVQKINYMVQFCMLFLMMYSKLGHKLTNVKTARIDKLLIAFVK